MSLCKETTRKKGRLIVCPFCLETNTQRIQNELAKIPNPIFSQGPEWLGYCHDCGCLYDYHSGRIINIPGIKKIWGQKR